MNKFVKLIQSHPNYQIFLCGFYITILINFVASLEVISTEKETSSDRHFHHIRHSRDRRSSPYKSAASVITNTYSNKYESFSLNCPHVADASSDKVCIEVSWTLNDTIWLKIEGGEMKIVNRLTTFNKKIVAGKTVLRVLLNNGRYFFDYDELTGDFSMEIRPVQESLDGGVWQCHVTVYQEGNTHTLTSRSRVKTFHEHRWRSNDHLSLSSQHFAEYLTARQKIEEPWEIKERNKVTSFIRNEQKVVQINREEIERPNTIVFSRQVQPIRPRHAYASIDYELSMNELYEEPNHLLESRARSAYFNDATSTIYFSLVTTNFLILHLNQ